MEEPGNIFLGIIALITLIVFVRALNLTDEEKEIEKAFELGIKPARAIVGDGKYLKLEIESWPIEWNRIGTRDERGRRSCARSRIDRSPRSRLRRVARRALAGLDERRQVRPAGSRRLRHRR